MTPKSKTVVVAGDITLDWNLLRSRRSQRHEALWDPDYYTKSRLQPGGAALLCEMITEALKGNKSIKVLPLTPDDDDKVPGNPPLWHSYTICEQFPKTDKESDRNSPWVWRVKEFLGLEPTKSNGDDGCQDRRSKNPKNYLKDDDGSADVIIVDNANQGFQDLEDIWPVSLKKRPQKNTWLVLKWARPDFDTPGKLWTTIADNFKDRLVVVVTINDLRLREMRISRALSWERTALDLVRAMNSQSDVLSKCAHLVVSMYTEGAVVFSKNGRRQSNATLHYDPQFIENTWSLRYPGKMVGYTQCLAAGIALQLISDHRNIGPGVVAGLAAARDLHEKGFDEVPRSTTLDDHISQKELLFPVKRIADKLNQVLSTPLSPAVFHQQQLPTLGHHRSASWTILDEQYPDNKAVRKLAKKIVEEGKADEDWTVPIGRFGKLLTINRAEIESLRAIRSLISGYLDSPTLTTPVCIAVFGPPGSGKSFAIKAVAKSLGENSRVQELTFNISQFTDPESILSCLHQVRDVALSEKMPLVFWDEFDTKLGDTELGWLRYFLSPMQDGKFQQASLTHNVGRAIFVFAGGTRRTMEQFTKDATKAGAKAKGTDFLSRLRGFVNIPTLDHPKGKLENGVVIRRALLLRAILEESAPNLIQYVGQKGRRLNVDSGVLEGFFCVPTFKYGARSMEAITKMSMLSGKSMYERSSLPSETQLKLHVDAQDFLKLVTKIPKPVA